MLDNTHDMDGSGSGSSSNSDGRSSNGDSTHGPSSSPPPTPRRHAAPTSGRPRGFSLGMTWMMPDGTAAVLDREYDAWGDLLEVRYGTAVKGDGSGGRV